MKNAQRKRFEVGTRFAVEVSSTMEDEHGEIWYLLSVGNRSLYVSEADLLSLEELGAEKLVDYDTVVISLEGGEVDGVYSTNELTEVEISDDRDESWAGINHHALFMRSVKKAVESGRLHKIWRLADH